MNIPPIQTAPVSLSVADILDEKLTASEWVKLLDVAPQVFRRQVGSVAQMQVREGRMVQVFAQSALPALYLERVTKAKEQHAARSCAELLAFIACETRRKPDLGGKSWESFPESAKNRAKLRMLVFVDYYAAVNIGRPETECVRTAIAAWRRVFSEDCNEKTIRRWRDRLAQFGGEHATREAYLDSKSVAHPRARREHKLGIPVELVAEFKDRCTKAEHISSAFESIVADWECGRDVPGLGINERGAAFPWNYKQLRAFAPSNPARRLGSHGKARARRECLPHTLTSTANLRPNELWVLDDTRLDIIATHDLTGRPVELKSYWLMDVATRRILAFQVVEDGNLTADFVFTMLSRAPRVAGLPANYPLHIKFERGTVACAPATETLLRSMWGSERIRVHRTSMDGGRNHAGDFLQAPSGHWMGKAHIESFMRTLAFRLENLPGQRGGDYRRQPAQLGLEGRNRSVGLLTYTAGSQMHEGARGELADRLLRWIDTGDIASERRLEVSALKPVSWIVSNVSETVARYNTRSEHRMEGFERIEWQDDDGSRKWRMESPNEKWARLSLLHRLEPIAEADAVSLLKCRARVVTVTRNGVFVTVDGAKFQFFRSDSRVIHEVNLLTTQQRRYVALLDEDALRHFNTATPTPTELHLLDATAPGEEGRYLETLPLHAWPDYLDADAQAKAAAHRKTVEARYQGELLQARRPTFARDLAQAELNTERMRGAVTLIRDEVADATSESELLQRTREGLGDEPSRASQRAEAAPSYAAGLPTIEAAKDCEL